MAPDQPPVARRRLKPEERREHIVEAARRVFAERPYEAVSMGDVAKEAGVARSLVHHYFGGMRELYLAIVVQAASSLVAIRELGPEVPFERRSAENLGAALDRIGEHRDLWMAVVGRWGDSPDPQLQAVIEASVTISVERALRLNADLLEDTPTARLALRCFHHFWREAVRAWIRGETSQEEAHRLVVQATRDLFRHTIPALERAGAGAGAGEAR